jgi:MoaA/NifB/PqqE/SkfB family radical SAM enzyme
MPRIGLHLTNRCQLDCAHCLRDPGQKPLDLPLDVARQVIEEAHRLYGIRHVSLTGGEPTLYPELDGLLSILSRTGWTWDIVTNGYGFATRLLPLIPTASPRRDALSRVLISLDGATAETHDAIRGEGSFREATAAMGVCSAMGIPFGAQMTVHAQNVSSIEDVALLVAGLGADQVSFAMMQPTGTPHDARLRLRLDGWHRAQAAISRLASLLKIRVVLPEGWPDRELTRTCGPLRGETLHIDVEGRLTLCCLHSEVPGPEENLVAGDVRQGLVLAHRRLLELQRAAVDARLAELESGVDDPWQELSCNGCLRRFGKPHWTEDGVAGATAERERWRGAWAKSERTFLPLLQRRDALKPMA